MKDGQDGCDRFPDLPVSSSQTPCDTLNYSHLSFRESQIPPRGSDHKQKDTLRKQSTTPITQKLHQRASEMRSARKELVPLAIKECMYDPSWHLIVCSIENCCGSLWCIGGTLWCIGGTLWWLGREA